MVADSAHFDICNCLIRCYDTATGKMTKFMDPAAKSLENTVHHFLWVVVYSGVECTVVSM